MYEYIANKLNTWMIVFFITDTAKYINECIAEKQTRCMNILVIN